MRSLVLNVREMNSTRLAGIRKDHIYMGWGVEADINSICADTASKGSTSFMLTEKLKPKEQTKYHPPKISLIYSGGENTVLHDKSYNLCISLSTSIK